MKHQSFSKLRFMIPYIDIHTHQHREVPHLLQLLNCIIGKGAIPETICSVGIHPWYVEGDGNTQWALLKQQATSTQVLAIGECGLDKLTDTPWDKQIEIFECQILLANKLQKPLIIHCVRAFQETMIMLKAQKVQVPVLFHGFNKKKEVAQALLRQGYYLSLGSAILKGQMDDILIDLPLEKIFFETDDKSTNVVDIYSYFCTVRKISMDDLRQQISKNFQNVFRYTLSA